MLPFHQHELARARIAHQLATESGRDLPAPPMRGKAETAKVTIYTKPLCPYCIRAKRLLRRHAATIHEIRATLRPKRVRAELRDRFGVDTFPQIVIAGRHIGGADELLRLDQAGQLQQLLAQ